MTTLIVQISALERVMKEIIGDRKVFFDYSTENPSERRIRTSGKYDNQSKLVRVLVSTGVDRGLVPPKALPFGFHGFVAYGWYR